MITFTLQSAFVICNVNAFIMHVAYRRLPVTSPHGNFATVTSPHGTGNFAALSYIENLHSLHRNKSLNSSGRKRFYRAFAIKFIKVTLSYGNFAA